MVARRARSLAREPRDHLKERCPRCHRHGPGPGKLLARHRKTLLAPLGMFTDLVAGEAERMLVALVAGATRGAGRAIAVELARAGFFVYATGRSSRATGASELGRPETIEETGDLIHTAGGEGRCLRCHRYRRQQAGLLGLPGGLRLGTGGRRGH